MAFPLFIGGPSRRIEPVTELSIELFRFWNSISSWGFRFEGYQMWCGFISLDLLFRFDGKVDRGDPDFRSLSSLFYGGRFL